MSAERQKTILLVEDEAITAMSEKMILEKFGYRILIAYSGEEAAATVAKTPGIDLILMDINLGAGIDGPEAAAIILKDHDLPVVFLSSHTEPEVVEKTEKITSYGYVVKNSSSTVLDASIKMAFKLFEAKIKEKEKESQTEAALAALRESEQRLNFHVNNSPLATIEWTTDFIVTRWSGEAEKIFGWNQSETIGKPMMDLQIIYDEDIPIVQKTMGQLSDGSSKYVVSINRNYTKEGKVIICEWYNSVLLNPQGKLISVMSQAMDITERKQAEEAIFQSKKDWEDCFDSITDMITIHDNDYNIIRSNKAGKALLKLPELEKHLKLKCFSFYHGTEAPPAGCLSCDCLKSGRPGVFELFEPFLHRYLEIRAIPRFDSNNQRAGLIHIVRDITERKQRESKREVALAALQENEERMKAIIEGTPHLFFYTQDAEANTTYVSPTIEHITGHKTDIWLKRKDWFITDATINQVAKDRTHAHLRGEFTEEPILLEVRHAIGHPILLETYEYPITKNGRVVGLQGVAHDITQRKLVESQREVALEALRESEERLRDIIFSMADWVWEMDGNGVYTYSSEKGLDFLGSSRGDIIGKTPFDFMPADEAKRVAPIFSEIVANKRPIKDLENWNIGKNGERICLLTNGVPILDEKGNFKGYRGVDKDITERKQAEASLKQALDWQQTIFEGSRDAIFISDQDSRFVAVNNAACDLTGYSREQLLKMRIPDIHDLPDLDAYKMYHQKIFGGEEILSEAKILRSDSAKIDTEFNNRCVSIAGKLYMHTTARNITERKQAEILERAVYEIARAADEAKSLDDLYQSVYLIIKGLMPAANFLIALYDEKEDLVSFPYFVDEIDSPPPSRKPDKGLTDYVLRTGVTLLCDAALEKELDRRGEVKRIGHLSACWLGVPLKTGDKTIGVIALDNYSDPQAYGEREKKILEYISSQVANAIERKQAESQREAASEALRESEDRYRDLVENSQDLICTHDLEGKILSMNEPAARLTGYPLKDLLGMNMTDLLVPEVRHLFKTYLAEIQAKGWSRGTMRIRTASGEPRYWEYYNTLRTKGVNIAVVRALGHDITEREQAEVEIKRQLAEKEILLKEVHHRIKNNIAAIGGLISLRLQSTSNPEAITVLKDAIGRVNSMRVLYDKLLLSEDYKNISVKNYLDDLIDTIIAIFPDKTKIKIERRIANFNLDAKQLFPLGSIINELLTNTMKYAFLDRDAGLIKIALSKVDNHVTLTVQDNGRGLPDGFDIDKSKGFGLTLVKMLSQQLGGSFSMENLAGTRCTVAFNI